MSTLDKRFSGRDKRDILFGIAQQLEASNKPSSIWHADLVLQTLSDEDAARYIKKR